MDGIDRAIIRHLQADGRLANTELADKVSLTPSPCLRRVRALEEAGIITGYHASVDPHALERGFRVLVHIEMATQDTATIEAFEAHVAEVEAVEECVRLFGQPDYLLWVAVKDLSAYEQLYMSTITGLPGVARTHSQFPMKAVKAPVAR
jgi:DNA-binding Lrp family transcriptional regulator